MTLTNGKISSISDLVKDPTRQQEGDEAMKQKWYEERAQEIIRQEDMVSLTEALTVQDAACAALARKALMAREPLATEAIDWLDSITRPATVQPEDETTLPAMDAKELPFSAEERLDAAKKIDYIMERDENVVLTIGNHGYLPGIVDIQCRLTTLEAERDALKAENEELKSATSVKNTFWGQYKAQRQRADTLQSQLDAVVGQETPQEAWDMEPGTFLCRWCNKPIFHNPDGMWIHRFTCATHCDRVAEPKLASYTPPLKAGQ